MDSVLKKGLFLVTISSLVMGISSEVQAADTDSVLPGAGIEEVLNDYDTSDHKVQVKEYLVPTEKGEYSDMAFANVHSFLYIRSEPTKQSKWVGKLYPDYAAKIKGPVGEWTKIKSGDVTGYVYSQYITIGKKAQKRANLNEEFTLHSFRHSHVSLLIDLGYSPTIVADRIGDTVDTVLKTYSHLYAESKESLSEKLNNLYK